MSDASSGRDSRNAGSDSRKHYSTSVVDAYKRTPAPGKSTPTTARSIVRTVAKADSTTAPPASGNVRPSDFE